MAFVRKRTITKTISETINTSSSSQEPIVETVGSAVVGDTQVLIQAMQSVIAQGNYYEFVQFMSNTKNVSFFGPQGITSNILLTFNAPYDSQISDSKYFTDFVSNDVYITFSNARQPTSFLPFQYNSIVDSNNTTVMQEVFNKAYLARSNAIAWGPQKYASLTAAGKAGDYYWVKFGILLIKPASWRQITFNWQLSIQYANPSISISTETVAIQETNSGVFLTQYQLLQPGLNVFEFSGATDFFTGSNRVFKLVQKNNSGAPSVFSDLDITQIIANQYYQVPYANGMYAQSYMIQPQSSNQSAFQQVRFNVVNSTPFTSTTFYENSTNPTSYFQLGYIIKTVNSSKQLQVQVIGNDSVGNYYQISSPKVASNNSSNYFSFSGYDVGTQNHYRLQTSVGRNITNFWGTMKFIVQQQSNSYQINDTDFQQFILTTIPNPYQGLMDIAQLNIGTTIYSSTQQFTTSGWYNSGQQIQFQLFATFVVPSYPPPPPPPPPPPEPTQSNTVKGDDTVVRQSNAVNDAQEVVRKQYKQPRYLPVPTTQEPVSSYNIYKYKNRHPAFVNNLGDLYQQSSKLPTDFSNKTFTRENINELNKTEPAIADAFSRNYDLVMKKFKEPPVLFRDFQRQRDQLKAIAKHDPYTGMTYQETANVKSVGSMFDKPQTFFQQMYPPNSTSQNAIINNITNEDHYNLKTYGLPFGGDPFNTTIGKYGPAEYNFEDNNFLDFTTLWDKYDRIDAQYAQLNEGFPYGQFFNIYTDQGGDVFYHVQNNEEGMPIVRKAGIQGSRYGKLSRYPLKHDLPYGEIQYPSSYIPKEILIQRKKDKIQVPIIKKYIPPPVIYPIQKHPNPFEFNNYPLFDPDVEYIQGQRDAFYNLLQQSRRIKNALDVQTFQTEQSDERYQKLMLKGIIAKDTTNSFLQKFMNQVYDASNSLLDTSGDIMSSVLAGTKRSFSSLYDTSANALDSAVVGTKNSLQAISDAAQYGYKGLNYAYNMLGDALDTPIQQSKYMADKAILQNLTQENLDHMASMLANTAAGGGEILADSIMFTQQMMNYLKYAAYGTGSALYTAGNFAYNYPYASAVGLSMLPVSYALIKKAKRGENVNKKSLLATAGAYIAAMSFPYIAKEVRRYTNIPSYTNALMDYFGVGMTPTQRIASRVAEKAILGEKQTVQDKVNSLYTVIQNVNPLDGLPSPDEFISFTEQPIPQTLFTLADQLELLNRDETKYLAGALALKAGYDSYRRIEYEGNKIGQDAQIAVQQTQQQVDRAKEEFYNKIHQYVPQFTKIQVDLQNKSRQLQSDIQNTAQNVIQEFNTQANILQQQNNIFREIENLQRDLESKYQQFEAAIKRADVKKIPQIKRSIQKTEEQVSEAKGLLERVVQSQYFVPVVAGGALATTVLASAAAGLYYYRMSQESAQEQQEAAKTITLNDVQNNPNAGSSVSHNTTEPVPLIDISNIPEQGYEEIYNSTAKVVQKELQPAQFDAITNPLSSITVSGRINTIEGISNLLYNIDKHIDLNDTVVKNVVYKSMGHHFRRVMMYQRHINNYKGYVLYNVMASIIDPQDHNDHEIFKNAFRYSKHRDLMDDRMLKGQHNQQDEGAELIIDRPKLLADFIEKISSGGSFKYNSMGHIINPDRSRNIYDLPSVKRLNKFNTKFVFHHKRPFNDGIKDHSKMPQKIQYLINEKRDSIYDLQYQFNKRFKY